jgi:hypothetical protein
VATIKAQFDNGLVMLLGDSYKRWPRQLSEYVVRFNKRKPESILVSDERWLQGIKLKWCNEENFQKRLDEEGLGRKVSDFKFRKPTVDEVLMLNSVFDVKKI